jgi:hypothetical protein
MTSPKTIADMEFEKMYNETGTYLQQQLAFSSTTQPASNTLKKHKKTSNKRVSFSAEINCKRVERLYETDSERENLWWPASNKANAAASKCMERFWRRDNIYRWTIDEEAWLNYDIKLTLAAARASWAKRIAALNEDGVSDLPTVTVTVTVTVAIKVENETKMADYDSILDLASRQKAKWQSRIN